MEPRNWSQSKWLIGGAGVVLALALVAGGAYMLRGDRHGACTAHHGACEGHHGACEGKALGRAHPGGDKHGLRRAHARAHRAFAHASAHMGPHARRGFAAGVHPAHFDFEFDFDDLPEGAHKWMGAHGMAPRGRIGVHLQPMTEDLRAYFKAPKEQGVLVTTVREDSPAEKAGVRAGDVILEAAGDEARSPRDVVRAVAQAEEGKPIALTLLRDGRKQNISVTPEHAKQGKRHAGKKMRGRWKSIEQRLQAIEERLGLETPDADSKAQ